MIDAPLPSFAVTDAQYQALLPTLRLVAGSADVATLARALALTDGFALHLVGCETPHLAQALILLLAREVPKLRGLEIKMVRLEPTRADADDRAGGLDAQMLSREVFDRLMLTDERPRVIFLDATDSRTDDRPAWIWLFQRLNERRNHLAKIAAPLVLLLPFELELELVRFAPDLWSIRSAGLKLRSGARPRQSGLEPAASIPMNARRSLDLGEDTRALQAEVNGLLQEAGPHAKRALAVTFQRLATTLHEQGRTELALALLREKILPHLLSSDADLRPELTLTAMQVLVRLGQAEEAERLVQEDALPKLEQAKNWLAITNLFLVLAQGYRARKQTERALEILQARALPSAELLGEPTVKAEVVSQIVLDQLALGHLEQAQRLVEKEGHLLKAGLRPSAGALLRLTLADSQRSHGDPESAIATLRADVLPYCQNGENSMLEAMAWIVMGQAHRDRGELQEAISLWSEKAVPRYHQLGNRGGEALARVFIASALRELGRRDEGLALLRREARAISSWPTRTRHEALERSNFSLEIASGLVSFGQIEEAEELLRGALADTLPLWPEESAGLAQRLVELTKEPASAPPAAGGVLHTQAGPEVWTEGRRGDEHDSDS